MSSPARLATLLDRLAPWLERFAIERGRIVVAVNVQARRLELERAIAEGEHDLVTLAIELLDQVDEIVGVVIAMAGARS